MVGGLPYTFDEALPERTRVTPLRFLADDGMESAAWLYEPPSARRTVIAMAHPRAEFGRHYAIPSLVAAGWPVFAHNLRHLNHDTEMIYERLLLDVAAGMRWLRARGFDKVVLHGNCGGGPLYAAYQRQARLPAAQRWNDTPGGGRVDLGGDMPAADGFIISAAHPGEGQFLLQTIDPSVTDERDPLSCDPSLDMFNPANGYDLATRTARYSPEFLARYRAAQRERVGRLDAVAREAIAGERAARERLRTMPRDPYDLLKITREAIPHRLMVIYRTVANPAYLDTSIDPSPRPVGTIFGLLDARPEFGNYFNLNIARVLAPRAWLSVWSGLSSRVRFADLAAGVSEPTLFVHPRGDTDILPAAANEIWNAIAARDRTRIDLEHADHYLRPLAAGAAPRRELARVIDAWMTERFA